jgi:RND family efflux transporter MFP subunit
LKIILPIAIALAGIIITVVLIKSRAPVAIRPSHEYAPLVRTLEATFENYQLTVSTHGTVTPRTETSLVSEVAGRVVKVASSFAAGGFFEKGDILVSIDPRDYELAVITSRGQVAQAKVRAELEDAQAKVAREEWEELGDGKTSPLATRELQLEEARAALAAAEAALEKAERNLERTSIRAPFTGRVRNKIVDIGQFVSPGTPVASVFAVDYVEVRLPIPDSDLAFLDLQINFNNDSSNTGGPDVRFFSDFAGKRQQWDGRVVRVEGEIDPISRMVHVVAQVDDPYGMKKGKDYTPLTIGLFVEAEIMGHAVDNAIILPRSAIRGNDTVLIVDKDSRLRFRAVEVLRTGRTDVVITGGLNPGESICVSTIEAVTDGMKIRTADSVQQPVAPDSSEMGDNR